MENIILETKRLIIRKPDTKDFNDLHEGVDNINVAKCIASMSNPYPLSGVGEYYGTQIKKWESKNPTDLLFIIELKSENKAIGAIGLHSIDYKKGTSETGSWINESYWRNGYMTEAKIAVNTFAFNELGLKKLLSPVFADNAASNATQKKMGYELVGFKEKACKCLATGKVHDENFYELTKDKWNMVLSALKDRTE